LRCEGVNVFLADGAAAFQEVFHVHLHVFPRFTGDPFRIDADWNVQERDQLDKTAAAVRGGFLAVPGRRPGPYVNGVGPYENGVRPYVNGVRADRIGRLAGRTGSLAGRPTCRGAVSV